MQAPACVTACICKLGNRHRCAIAAPPIHLAMQTETHHSTEVREGVTGPAFPPLERVTKPNLTTAELAYYLNRQPQTLRGWACNENGPIRARRTHGRLDWPTADAKRIAGVAA